MKKSSPEDLIKHGLHFGHKTQRVHPAAKPYIWKSEKGISVIDLFKTAELLDKAIEFVFELGKSGKNLLIVATKKQANEIVTEICKENDVFHMTNKWVGGFITNYDEISKNLKKLRTLKEEKEQGAWDKFPKHEAVKKSKKLARILSIYSGVENLEALPDALFVIDIKREQNAVAEARCLSVPTVAVVDTNCDPKLVDYQIPANDDAVSSIRYLTEQIVAAYVGGRSKQKKKKE